MCLWNNFTVFPAGILLLFIPAASVINHRDYSSRAASRNWRLKAETCVMKFYLHFCYKEAAVCGCVCLFAVCSHVLICLPIEKLMRTHAVCWSMCVDMLKLKDATGHTYVTTPSALLLIITIQTTESAAELFSLSLSLYLASPLFSIMFFSFSSNLT